MVSQDRVFVAVWFGNFVSGDALEIVYSPKLSENLNKTCITILSSLGEL